MAMLVTHGADTGHRDRSGESTLWAACGSGDLDMVARLMPLTPWESNIRGESPMWIACARGHLAVAQLLRDSCVEMDMSMATIFAADLCGNSPLSQAAANGYTEVVGWLLEEGLEVGVLNCYCCQCHQAPYTHPAVALDILPSSYVQLRHAGP